MNWAAVAAITSLIGVLVTIITTAYTAGQMREKIQNHDNRLDSHDERLVAHDERLNGHQEKIGRLEEWKNGFNAAARVAGSKEVS